MKKTLMEGKMGSKREKKDVAMLLFKACLAKMGTTVVLHSYSCQLNG